MARYHEVPHSGDHIYNGAHHEIGGMVAAIEGLGLVRVESMDVVNDPRFFNDNVLNYRLAAFSGLSIVSGLLTQNAMDQLFGMCKVIPLWDATTVINFDSTLLMVSYFLLIVILISNMLATYIGVAQPYHTMRLMTAGPTGFDAAASYYLNGNIVSWRHMAIKGMLVSLPLYIFQMGLRLAVKFDKQTKDTQSLPKNTPDYSFIQGILLCALMQVLAFIVFRVHMLHFRIFRERYDVMTEMTKPLQGFMQQQMAPRAYTQHATGHNPFGFLDV